MDKTLPEELLMMLAYNHKYVVFSNLLPWPGLPSLGTEPVVSGGNITIFLIGDVDLITLSALPGWNVQRYLDVFYICTPVGSQSVLIINSLLDEIAFQYDDFVDKNRNLSNIDTLLQLVCDYYVDTTAITVLDFGCGTGLSKQVANKYPLNIIGYDRSSTMEEIARNNGMTVITSADIKRKTFCFDAIIASYVMHLLADYNAFIDALDCLKCGGIVACNFHKNYGYIELRDFMVAKFKNSIEFKLVDICDTHGTYVIIVKR